MTIKNSIKYLTAIKKSYLGDLSEHLSIAIEIMNKYQKIEEILDDWESDGGAFEMSESYWLNSIRKVIEDGSN